jgi:hypothetical protein
MNAVKTLVTTFGIFALGTAALRAQGEMLQLRFEGSCRSTNESGEIIKRNVNNRSLLRDYAQAHSITNINTLALVYHSLGDERGDVIQIVNARTGEVLADVLALFFSVDLPNGDGSAIAKEVSLFNSQQSFAIGSGILKEQLLDKKGNPDHRVSGTLQYYLLPTAEDGLQLCTANINASKTFTPKGPAATPTAATTTAPSRQTLLLASNL